MQSEQGLNDKHCFHPSANFLVYHVELLYLTNIHCSKKFKEHFENTSDLNVKKYYVG